MNKNQALQTLFAYIAEVYDKQLSDQAQSIYAELMSECTAREIALSIKMHVKDSERGRWSPKPAELHHQVSILRESDRKRVERMAHPVLTAGNIKGEYIEFDGGQFGLPGKHRCEVRLLTSYLQQQVAENGIDNSKLLEANHD